MEKKEIVYYRESFIQSVFADIVSFGVIFAMMAGNHYLLADNKITYFVLLVLALIFVIGKSSSRKHVFYSKEDAIKHIQES